MRYSVVVFLLCIFSGAALAQTTVPNTFTTGTAAQASQVNANFQALATAIDSGIPGYEIIQKTFSVPPTSGSAPQFTATCSSGKLVLGGGYNFNGAAYVQQSFPGTGQPGPQNSAWTVQINNISGGTQPLQVFAICALAHP